MFERFSEPAGRVVFFAQFEASRLGAATITTEHLLLGLLRENAWLVESLLTPGHTLRDLRVEAERAASPEGERVATSVELALAEPARMALTYAEEESGRLLSSTIDVPHLLLGLLRTSNSRAAKLLKEFGLKVDALRLKAVDQPVPPAQPLFGGVVCRFYGIEIKLDATAEAVPRLIAEYRGHMALIEIDPVKVIQSDLPPRAESMILEWVALRKDEISVSWKAAKAGKRPPPISPLE
ncbi:MAG: DUF4160 domain-containing protein [Acidobacteria bacterium]|nr:MAG: DUF4160 domain-containing protein [Acidobacteriota bacterium]